MSENKNIEVDLDSLFPVIAEQIRAGGTVRFMPKGTSMLPLIHQGKDTVVISPVKGRLKKYDVPFYRRDDGHFVLHRIVGEKDGKYILCGDNQYVREYGICHEHIIGVLTEVHTPDRIIRVTDKSYIRYSKRRVFTQRLKGKAVAFRNRVYRILGDKNDKRH